MRRFFIKNFGGLYRMFFAGLIVSVPFSVQASVLITEIMYDVSGTDTGREWIEVQNSGGTDVDLSLWKLFEANTNHKIVPTDTTGQSVMPAGSFAIIADSPAKFMADNPGFVGLVFDSAFSLNNAGEVLILRDDNGADADTVSYLPEWGALGDGNSLQKSTSGVWISAPMTLGLPTTATEAVAPQIPPVDLGSGTSSPELVKKEPEIVGGENFDEDISVHSGQEVANTALAKPEFEITIGRPRIGFVGTPLGFETKISLAKNMPAGLGIRSVWAMGDGTELFGQNVFHSYEFAGDYIVVAHTDSGSLHATSKTLVRILEPELQIGLLQNDVVEIKNLGKGEINVGWFIIEDSAHRFILPRDTIIRARGSIRISPSITGIVSPKDFIRIASPSGKIFHTADIYRHDPLIALPDGVDIGALRDLLIKAFKPQ